MKFSVKQWLAEPRVLGGKRIFAIAYVLKHWIGSCFWGYLWLALFDWNSPWF
jgi:hypothetical protein